MSYKTNWLQHLTAAALAFASLTAAAAVEEPIEAAAPQCVLKIATGPKGKGYSKLFRDIKSTCGATVPVCEVNTEGGLANLTLLSANQADVGFVPVDTIMDMKDSDENIGSLQSVMSLNNNLLHVATLTSGFTIQGKEKWGGLSREASTTVRITKFSDLKGRPVALVGSAQALARSMDKRLGYGLRFVDKDTDEQALESLRKGEVFAVFSTSGWPSGIYGKLKSDAGVTLIPFDLTVQQPYAVVRKNYPNMGVFNVPFMAVPNLLVTRPFKASGPNGRNVAALQRCITENLSNLQEGSFEPGWKEVKNSAESYGWTKFVPAADVTSVGKRR